MTVAVVREGGQWRIANFIHRRWDMASSLDSSVAELRAAPKVDCTRPPASDSESVRRDSTSSS